MMQRLVRKAILLKLSQVSAEFARSVLALGAALLHSIPCSVLALGAGDLPWPSKGAFRRASHRRVQHGSVRRVRKKRRVGLDADDVQQLVLCIKNAWSWVRSFAKCEC